MRALFDRVRTGTRLRRALGARQNYRGLSRARFAGAGLQGLAKRASQARGAAGVAARQAAADRRSRRSAIRRAAQRLYVLQLCRYAASARDQAGHQRAGAPQAGTTRPDRLARSETHACQRQNAARQEAADGGSAGMVQRRPFDLPHALAYARSRARTFRGGGLRLRLRARRSGAGRLRPLHRTGRAGLHRRMPENDSRLRRGRAAGRVVHAERRHVRADGVHVQSAHRAVADRRRSAIPPPRIQTRSTTSASRKIMSATRPVSANA